MTPEQLETAEQLISNQIKSGQNEIKDLENKEKEFKEKLSGIQLLKGRFQIKIKGLEESLKRIGRK